VTQINREVNEICESLFKQENMIYFAYIRQYDDGFCVPLISNGDLIKHHLDKEYLCYPSVPAKLLEQRKFHYIVMPNLEDGFTQAAHDYNIYFNISHPFYMFERYKNYFDLFVFSVASGNSSSVNTYFSNLPLLENFKFYFKEKAHTLISKALENKIYLPPHMQATFGGLNSNPPHSNQKFMPKKYFFEHDEKSFYLNSRHMEVLKCLDLGHTAKETGKILNISHRTIEAYIDEIKIKFNLNKKSQLISFCHEMNII
jgi:DNA-binding CsgD family transcriptional regulator